jgi:hypothetical protein
MQEYTVDQIQDIIIEAKQAAKNASHAWVADWTAKTGGNEYGEPMYCGFASTKIYGVKASTKMGRAMKAAGLEKDYSGAFSIWNPSEWRGQSMDVKEAGAQACADVFEKYGFRAYMESRAD